MDVNLNNSVRQRIALVQLDRAELFLYSLPAINNIIQSHVNAEFVCFVSSDVNEILPFCSLPNIVLVPRKTGEIEQIINNYSKEFDSLFNLSKTAEGLVLASGLNARKRTGLYLDGENGIIESSDPWCTYLEGVVGKSAFSPFHLSDIYAKVAATEFRLSETNLVPDFSYESLDQQVNSLCYSENVKLALAVGSINTSATIRLINSLLDRFSNLTIALIGTSRSLEQSQIISAACDSPRLINCVGKTNLADLAFIASAVNLSICKPGLFSQLCAGFGTFSICQYSEGSNLLEPAPYGHGHLIVEQLQSCGENDIISFYENIVEFLLSVCEGNAPNLEGWKSYSDGLIETHLQKLRIFLTQKVSGVHAGTESVELRLFPLLFTGYTYDETIRCFYRLLWELEIDNGCDRVEYLDSLQDGTISQLVNILKPLEKLGELAAFGIRYSNYILNYLKRGDLDGAKNAAAKLQEVDDIVHTLSLRHPELLPLKNFFTLQLAHVIDNDPERSSKAVENCYRDLQGRVLVLLELINSLFQQESGHTKEVRHD